MNQSETNNLDQQKMQTSTEPNEAAATAELSAAPAPDLESQIIEALKNVFDPEIPVNIYDLGLIYGVDVGVENNVVIRMTLTSPACPVAGSLPGEVEQKIRNIHGVADCKVELVWEPAWDKDKMTEAAKLTLNMY